MATPRSKAVADKHAGDRPQQPLAGRRILICRPRPDAERLARRFGDAGADVRILPTIAREALPETPETRTLIQNLDQFHHVIAVSPYAATLLLELLDTWWPQVPTGIHWYGVGAGTAAVLAAAGVTPEAPGHGWTSEDLLALPGLRNPDGERVLLVRGEEGRELIRDTLSQRGAEVTVLPLYRRYCPDYDKKTITDVLTDFDPEVIIALSGETLNNLVALGKNSNHNLMKRLLLVPAERVAEQARSAGFRWPCIPHGLADTDIVAAVVRELPTEQH